jgi:hypothetical protein
VTHIPQLLKDNAAIWNEEQATANNLFRLMLFNHFCHGSPDVAFF